MQLGTKMVAGLTTYAAPLKIASVTPAQLQAAVTALDEAESGVENAQSARLAVSRTYQAADTSLEAWLLKARAVLTTYLGAAWSNLWKQAGFIDNSTAVPRFVAGRITLAARLAEYFTAHPTQEAAASQVTAAKATELHAEVTTSQAQAESARMSLQMKLDTRDGACAILVRMMRDLVRVLGGVMMGDDPRWLSFGLNMPASNMTPGQPQNLTAFETPAGAIQAQCDAVPLATRYRWRIKVEGVDDGFRLGASTAAPLATIAKVKPAQIVEVQVQAANGSQGVASETVRVVLSPRESPREVVVRSVVMPAAAVAGEQNGDAHLLQRGDARHGNGAVAARS